MCAKTNDEKPGLIWSILKSKCTRCRRGDMFQYKNPYNMRYTMKMNERCPVCGQPLDLEPGFYYGTNMISYCLAVLLSVATFALWWLTIGFSLQDSRFFWWIGINALLLIALQPPLMRISRTVWLSFFVRYSPAWKEGDIVEQYNVNKDQQNNW
jgi:rRNA maturation protein Nop10